MDTAKDIPELILGKVCAKERPFLSLPLTALDCIHKDLSDSFDLVAVPTTKTTRKWFFRRIYEMKYMGVQFAIGEGHRRDLGSGSWSWMRFLGVTIGDKRLALTAQQGKNAVFFQIESEHPLEGQVVVLTSYDEVREFLVDYIASYTRSFQMKLTP